MSDEISHPRNLFGCAISPNIMMRRQTDRKVRRPFYLNDAAAFVRSAASTAKLI